MPRKTDHERLIHMLDAAKDVERFVTNCSYETFMSDRMRQYAVLRAIEIIGEAATNISPSFKDNHSEIPWRDIIGMRNHLVHAYFDIDIPLTWKTIIEDIPPLIEKLKKLL
jgi:uncharacterized protein with HEPN domain